MGFRIVSTLVIGAGLFLGGARVAEAQVPCFGNVVTYPARIEEKKGCWPPLYEENGRCYFGVEVKTNLWCPVRFLPCIPATTIFKKEDKGPIGVLWTSANCDRGGIAFNGKCIAVSGPDLNCLKGKAEDWIEEKVKGAISQVSSLINGAIEKIKHMFDGIREKAIEAAMKPILAGPLAGKVTITKPTTRFEERCPEGSREKDGDCYVFPGRVLTYFRTSGRPVGKGTGPTRRMTDGRRQRGGDGGGQVNAAGTKMNRNYVEVPPIKVTKLRTERTECAADTARIGAICVKVNLAAILPIDSIKSCFGADVQKQAAAIASITKAISGRTSQAIVNAMNALSGARAAVEKGVDASLAAVKKGFDDTVAALKTAFDGLPEIMQAKVDALANALNAFLNGLSNPAKILKQGQTFWNKKDEHANAMFREVNDLLSRVTEFSSSLGGGALNAATTVLRAATTTLDTVIKKVKEAADSISSAISKSGADVFGAAKGATDMTGSIVGCLIGFAKDLPIIKKDVLPVLDSFRAAIDQMKGRVSTFFADPGKAVREVAEDLVAKATKGIGDVIDDVSNLKKDLRALFTIELNVNGPGPKRGFDDDSKDAQIGQVFDQLAKPIKKFVEPLTALFPKPVAESLLDFGKAPLQKVFIAIAKVLILARSVVKDTIRTLAPHLIRGLIGADNFAQNIRAKVTGLLDGFRASLKLPKVLWDGMTKFIEKFIDDVIDNVSKGAGGLLELLGGQEIKDAVDKTLDSVVGAADLVKDAAKAVGAIGKSPKSAAEILGVLGDGVGVEDKAKRDRETADARKELAAAQAAYKTAEQAVQKARPTPSAADDDLQAAAKPAEPAFVTAQKALAKADERRTLAARRLARLEPQDAVVSNPAVVGIIADRLIDALLKLTWDPLMTFGELFSMFVGWVVDIAINVVTSALSVFPLTTTWTPAIVSVYHIIITLVMNVARSVHFSVIMPELRILVEDQLRDFKSILVDLARPGAGGAETQQSKELKKLLNLFQERMAGLKPFTVRLKKVRDNVKQGASGLIAGPLAKLFAPFPPEFRVAIQKAIVKGLAALRSAAVAGVKSVASGLAAGRALSPDFVVEQIVKALRPIVIEFMTAFVKNNALAKALQKAIDQGTKVYDTGPYKVAMLNPGSVLARIGHGIQFAKADLASALVGTFTGPDAAALGIDVVKKDIEKAVDAVAAELIKLESGGNLVDAAKRFVEGGTSLVAGVLEKVKPKAADLLTKRLPAAMAKAVRPAIEAALKDRRAVLAALDGGLPAFVAKAVQLSVDDIVKWVLPKGYPVAVQAETGAAMVRLARKPGDLMKLLGQGGLVRVVANAAKSAAQKYGVPINTLPKIEEVAK